MSFALDPPLLVASGAAIEAGIDDSERRERASAATVSLFVGVSVLLYANAPGLRRIWKPFGSKSGREFMLTSGMVPVRDEEMGAGHHLAAVAQFALYPLWLELGRRLVRPR